MFLCVTAVYSLTYATFVSLPSSLPLSLSFYLFFFSHSPSLARYISPSCFLSTALILYTHPLSTSLNISLSLSLSLYLYLSPSLFLSLSLSLLLYSLDAYVLCCLLTVIYREAVFEEKPLRAICIGCLHSSSVFESVIRQKKNKALLFSLSLCLFFLIILSVL